jgi:hypothetical protein
MKSSRGTRDKEMRRLLVAITKAGGTYRKTASGHFLVKGPLGMATIQGTFGTSIRARGNTLTTLRTKAGIDVS